MWTFNISCSGYATCTCPLSGFALEELCHVQAFCAPAYYFVHTSHHPCRVHVHARHVRQSVRRIQ